MPKLEGKKKQIGSLLLVAASDAGGGGGGWVSPWIPDWVSVDPRQTGVFVWIPAIFGGNCGSPTLS